MDDNKIEQMLAEIGGENGYGVFLLAQMDAVPDTLQFIIATTEYDASVDGLRDKHRYLVRAVGVQEHRISVGIFKSATVYENADHPLLYEYNTQPMALFFRGEVKNADALVLNLIQAYSGVFRDWHHVPDYLNTAKPLYDLFTGGGDLVGEMPAPLADALDKVLVAQGVETKQIAGERNEEQPSMKALLLDESYVVALDFTADLLGKQ